jgi:anti-sigma B factor antagonist
VQPGIHRGGCDMDVPLDIEIAEEQDSIVVRVAGDLDMWTSPKLMNVFTGIENEKNKRLQLDLAEITFLDSEAIKILIKGQRLLEEKSIRLSISACSPYVEKVFRISGVDMLLDVDVLDRH